MNRLPDNPLPALGDNVEIVYLAAPIRGMVVGRSFSSPQRIDILLPGKVVALGIPVNGSLRVLAS